MDKTEWEVCLKSLKKILAKKKEILAMTDKNLNRDIEELEFTIECYEEKIKQLKKCTGN
jgi:hypothetical protein